MRVEFSKDGQKFRPNSRFSWRGVTLNFYDKKSWRSTGGNGHYFSLRKKPVWGNGSK